MRDRSDCEHGRLPAPRAGKRAGMDEVSIPSADAGSGAATTASGTAKALVKGLALVDVVSAADAPVRLADLIAASGLPRSTVLRLLDVLLEQRLLQSATDGSFAGVRAASGSLRRDRTGTPT